MGFCEDASTTYLKRLGYNVVRHPRAGIRPLDLLGRQGDTTNVVGRLDDLVKGSTQPLPSITTGQAAADINGQDSSSLKLAVGVNVLGSIIGAMGGTLGVETSYTNAKTMKFTYRDVLLDTVVPAAVGQYLTDVEIAGESPLLRQYVLGNGNLYVLTDVALAKTITVKYEVSDGVSAKVDVPAIDGIVGGNVEVTSADAASGTVTYTGQTPLAFGFRCFAVGVYHGEVTMMASSAGSQVLAVGADENELAKESAILTPSTAALLDLDDAA